MRALDISCIHEVGICVISILAGILRKERLTDKLFGFQHRSISSPLPPSLSNFFSDSSDDAIV